MDTKDIVIAVLVISLIFVLGIVLGKRKTGNSTRAVTDIKNKEVTGGEISSPNRKPLKDYSREFVLLDDCHNRFKKLLPKLYEGPCYESFNEQFEIINQAYEDLSHEKEEPSRDAILKLVSTVLSGASFANVVSNVQKNADVIANLVLSGYPILIGLPS